MIQGAQWNVVCAGLEQKINRHLMADGPVVALGEGWKLSPPAPEVWFTPNPTTPEVADVQPSEVWLPERAVRGTYAQHANVVEMVATDWPTARLRVIEDGHVRDPLTEIAQPAPYVALIAEECMKRGATKILFYGLYLDGGRTQQGLMKGAAWGQLVRTGLDAGVELVRLKPTMVRL